MGGARHIRIFKYNQLTSKNICKRGCCPDDIFESDQVCETSYKDRGGKYQGQTGVTLPKT